MEDPWNINKFDSALFYKAMLLTGTVCMLLLLKNKIEE
jgi:hypothetical protein